MIQSDGCRCCRDDDTESAGFFFGLILGLMIGAVIAVLIYRHNKGEVIHVIKRKINKFILGLDGNRSSKTVSSVKKHQPKKFLVK